MPLDKKDFEFIERIVYKCGDDISVAIGRSFERLEERIDAAESRLYSRIAELEDKVEDSRQSATDSFEAVREDIRELGKVDL